MKWVVLRMAKTKVRVGVVGAAGLSAGRLIEILLRHPRVEIAWCASESAVGASVASAHPKLTGRTAVKFEPFDPARLGECDIVFSCRRPGETFGFVKQVLDSGCKLVDFSGDFRLKDPADFERWYGMPHSHPDLLGEAVYGLPEINRDRIAQARLVANPGCYTTTAILACAPVVRAGLWDGGPVVIDAISGVSGAGKTPKVENLFISVAENVRPYRVGAHQHTPEIEQELGLVRQAAATGAKGRPGKTPPVRILFVPHVGPYRVGIMADCYFRVASGVPEPSADDLQKLFTDAYRGEPFVRVLEHGRLPETANVENTNYCDIAPRYDSRSRTIAIFAATDNLVKGAAGQAVQNMNILFGFDEAAGLL